MRQGRAKSEDRGQVVTVRSLTDGRYSFSELPAGVYALSAKKDGYEDSPVQRSRYRLKRKRSNSDWAQPRDSAKVLPLPISPNSSISLSSPFRALQIPAILGATGRTLW